MRRIRPVVALLAVLAAAPAAPAAASPTRYTLAHGCYSISGVGSAQRVRMQPTALGRYLLYRPDRTFVSADGSPASAPSPTTEWIVRGARRGAFTLRPTSNPTQVRTVHFRRARGCAIYPEAELDARGRPVPAPTSYGRVGGLLEGHMHWMSFQYFGGEFHCGAPWNRYGIPYALPDCAGIEGPQGTEASFQNTLNFGDPAHAHDTRGWPQLTSFSKDNLTYEGTYWRWVQRAYLGGLRMMVMGVNENRVLCQLQTKRDESCNEMTTVRRGLEAIRQLQDYVDAQAGGPHKGFFQIVTNPYDARRVINQGRMAVVLEIEVSEPFDCRDLAHPTCDPAQVDRQLDEVHRLGVRSMLLVNKFDNPLTGVRFDDGTTGLLINAGNKESAGSFWSAKTCTGPLHDNTIYSPVPGSGQIGSLLGRLGLPAGTAPVYPPAPHCNTRGLTALGHHVVQRLMDMRMVVNPDHMSQAAVDATLTDLEKRHYSGVISPHGWMDPGNWPRLWKLGGLAFPGHSSAQEYVDDWKRYRPRETPYDFGWGYGADLGGLSHQPGLTGESGKLTYPFKSYDGRVTFTRQKTGERTFDYTKEGVAHYGLYADWFADLRRVGGPKLARDMWDGAEAYLEMWERADGIKAPGCSAAGARIPGALRLGTGWRTLLRRAGQPQQRTRAWSWCVRGPGNARAADVAVLSRSGQVELVGSTARGRRGVGARSPRDGIAVRGTRVTVARSGRVRAVAVASPAVAGRPNALDADVALLLRARATQAPRRFVPSAAEAALHGRLTGRALAGTGNPRLDAAVALLCGLRH